MNAADLATTLAVFGCPIAAGIASASEKTGWFTILYVLGGLAVGIVVGYGVHKLAYLLLAVCRRHSKKWIGWPLLIVYSTFPMIIAVGAMCGALGLSAWLAKH